MAKSQLNNREDAALREAVKTAGEAAETLAQLTGENEALKYGLAKAREAIEIATQVADQKAAEHRDQLATVRAERDVAEAELAKRTAEVCVLQTTLAEANAQLQRALGYRDRVHDEDQMRTGGFQPTRPLGPHIDRALHYSPRMNSNGEERR
jgi:hypothetical protein